MELGKTRAKVRMQLSGSKPHQPNVKALSDEQLKKAVDRLQLEKRHAELTNATKSKNAGAEFAKHVASTTLKTAATAIATQQVHKALKKHGLTT